MGPAAAEDETLTLEDILKSWGGRKANEFERIAMRWGAVLCRMKEQPQWTGDPDGERLEALYKICIRLMENSPQ